VEGSETGRFPFGVTEHSEDKRAEALLKAKRVRLSYIPCSEKSNQIEACKSLFFGYNFSWYN